MEAHMESMRFKFLATAGVLGLLVGGVQAQERIVNGDMGLFGGAPQNQAGVPDGWTASDAITPRFTPSSSATNSPFTNVYADNSLSWLLEADDATKGDEGYHQQGSPIFASPVPVANVNFDFNLASITTNTWGVQFNNTGAPPSVVSLMQFRIDDSFNAAPWTGAGNTPSADIIALTAGVWYNVSATLDPAGGTYSGTITPFGSSGTPFSGAISTTAIDPAGRYISGVLIRDRSVGASSDMRIDNVSVTPEPASLSLLALGGLALARRRK
jgi:MYXO-CTERM domain-containing protein